MELYAFAVVSLEPVSLSRILGSTFWATESPTYSTLGFCRYFLLEEGCDEDADVGGGAGDDLVHGDGPGADGPGADGGPCGGEVEDFEWSGSL